MDLRERHISESNLLAFKFACIIQAFEIISTIVYRSGRVGFLSTGVILALQIIGLVTYVCCFFRFRKESFCGTVLMCILLAVYLILMVGSVHVPYLWAFGPSLLILSLLYSDVKITLITGVTVPIINFIYIPLFRAYSVEMAARINMVMTDFVFSLLLALMAIFYVRLSSRQNHEKLEELELAAEQQRKDGEVMKEIAVRIGQKLEDANDAMESLSEKVSNSARSSEEISTAITHTAESVQTQTEMNANITASLDDIAHQSRAMRRNSDEVTENVEGGNKLVKELQSKSEEASKINAETAEMTQNLQHSASTVKDIVSTILNISGQTNLLALNASIEAARAGEAGRGFAVVAEEIRELSQHTKESAEQIAATIDDLVDKVNLASTNMELSVESANAQGELIKETGAKFTVILEKVSDLTGRAKIISDNVDSCVGANTKVMDAISNLSATSEQVAASAQTNIELGRECMDDMSITKEILDEILEISRAGQK